MMHKQPHKDTGHVATMEREDWRAYSGEPSLLPGTVQVRAFDSGATRSPDTDRYDPEGFLSPICIERYCEYMNKNRIQSDGKLRDPDNWQKGMPSSTYIKGMWRHFLHLWTRHRGHKVMDTGACLDMEEDLCSIIFNANGMLFEILKGKR